jgi:acetyl esterase/lipase
MGASAGGGLTLGTTLRALDEGWGKDKIKGCVAIVPVTVHPDAVPQDVKEKGEYVSYEKHGLNSVNTASAMQAFFGLSAPLALNCAELICPRNRRTWRPSRQYLHIAATTSQARIFPSHLYLCC